MVPKTQPSRFHLLWLCISYVKFSVACAIEVGSAARSLMLCLGKYAKITVKLFKPRPCSHENTLRDRCKERHVAANTLTVTKICFTWKWLYKLFYGVNICVGMKMLKAVFSVLMEGPAIGIEIWKGPVNLISPQSYLWLLQCWHTQRGLALSLYLCAWVSTRKSRQADATYALLIWCKCFKFKLKNEKHFYGIPEGKKKSKQSTPNKQKPTTE